MNTLFNLLFANQTVLSCFFFLNWWPIFFLLDAIIAQIFNSIAELVIPVEIPSKESKAEIENTSSNCRG